MLKSPEQKSGINKTAEKALIFLVYPITKGLLTIPTQPLANVMVEGQKKSISFGQAFKNLYEMGWRRFFQGTVPSVTREVQKSAYKGWLTANAQDWSTQLLTSFGFGLPDSSLAVNVLAGSITGTLDAVFSGPTERYKTYALAYEGNRPLNVRLFWQALSEAHADKDGLARYNGIRNELWRGFATTSAKQTIMISAFFVAFTASSQWMQPYKEDNPGLFKAGVTIFSGCAAATASAPLDVAKTLIQKDIGSEAALIQRLNHIFKQGGTTALTRGLGAKCALTAIGYGFTALFLDTVKQSRQSRHEAMQAQEALGVQPEDDLTRQMGNLSLDDDPRSKKNRIE